jgi:putative transposase
VPRKPRFFLNGIPVHAVQRGHNQAAVFFDDLEYLRCLKEAAEITGCMVHAYALMTNHIHLLLTPKSADSVGRMFQSLGRQYVRHINKTYRRRGTLWEGRYKCNVIQSDRYLLTCMRYIEMNPVRARMIRVPVEYRWSSFSFNALGEDNSIVSPHAEYLALGNSTSDRQAAYRDLFRQSMSAEELDMLRCAMHSGTPLGNDRFRRQIEMALGRKIGEICRGRPKVSKESGA